jgi:hypothetical protein
MQKINLAFLLLFVWVKGAGQVKFLEGIVIDSVNVAKSGYIEYRDWTKNPSKINYRNSKTGTTISYSPFSIEQFEINGICKYLSTYVEMDPNPVSTEQASAIRQPFVKGKFFLKVLVQGEKATLYEFIDSKPHYFIQYGKGPITELVYALMMDASTGNISFIREYRNQLTMEIATDSLKEEKMRQAEKLQYTERDLSRFVASLNGTNLGYTLPSKKGKRSVFFAGAGYAFHRHEYRGVIRFLNSIDFKNINSYSFTGGVDLMGAKDFQRLIFRTELTFSTVTFKGKGVSQHITAGPLEYNDFVMKQRNITPSVSAIYQFLTIGKARMYGGFGLEYNFSFYGENRLITISTIDNESTVTNDPTNAAKAWLAYGWKTGVIVNGEIEAGISGRMNGAMTASASVGENTNKTALWVCWRFNKKK